MSGAAVTFVEGTLPPWRGRVPVLPPWLTLELVQSGTCPRERDASGKVVCSGAND